MAPINQKIIDWIKSHPMCDFDDVITGVNDDRKKFLIQLLNRLIYLGEVEQTFSTKKLFVPLKR